MKLLAPFLLLAAILIGATWWDDTPADADLVFVNRGEVFTLDPQRMSYLQDFRLAYALYEGLVRWNNITLAIEPACADLPEISPDGRVYTFPIQPEARWSNGDPVTAHDFVFSMQRLLMPDTAADYSNLFFDINGAKEFFRWRGEQLAAFTSEVEASGAVGGDAEAVPTGTDSSAQALFAEANQRFHDTVGVRALDDRTLQITLERPVAYFLDLLCFAVAYPVHRPTVEGWPNAATLIDAERGWAGVIEHGWGQRSLVKLDPITGRLEQKHEWARPGRFVSNGPYVLAEWRYKRDMRLERNPHYHRPEMIRSDSVVMLSIEDANTAVLAYESGRLDWLSDMSAEYQADMLEQRERYVARYRSEIDAMLANGSSLDDALAALPPPAPRAGERRNIHALPTFGIDFFGFNCRPALADGSPNPFADARVRRGFALAVDKEAIVRTATRLNEPIMNTLIPPGSIPGYASPAGLNRDVGRARAELAVAGWIDRNRDGSIEDESGAPFPTVDLLWTTNQTRYKWISLELKSQWERELGVRVELRSADTKFYKEDLKLGKYMIARGRWYGDYGDPTTFLDINKTGDGNNDRGFSDPSFDALLDEAASEGDAANRMRILEEAERYLFEEQMPLIPICQLVQLYMYEPGKLKGLTSHPRLIQYLWQMEATR